MHELYSLSFFASFPRPPSSHLIPANAVSRYSHLFGRENREDVTEQLERLMMTHPTEDIRVKARMVHSVISGRDEEED